MAYGKVVFGGITVLSGTVAPADTVAPSPMGRSTIF